MDRQIIAVDFDGTLCDNAYPAIGAPNFTLIDYIIQRKRAGDIVILWTCRHSAHLSAAVAWCSRRGIVFDYINQNTPENIQKYGETRKVFADMYIDDKAIAPQNLIRQRRT